MLKLRNAVLTALLAFCLAMPFVSCSFNDGATGDVSGDVKVQSGNNQNGGNGGSTGGNENPSGDNNGGNEKPGEGTMYTVMYSGSEITTIPESVLSVYAATYGLVEGTDYTIDGTVITLTEAGYAKVQAAGEGGGQEPGTNEPGYGEGTVYTVKYGDIVIAPDMPESALSDFVQTYGLTKDTDYTISGTVITLTESGFNKLQAAGSGAGE